MFYPQGPQRFYLITKVIKQNLKLYIFIPFIIVIKNEFIAIQVEHFLLEENFEIMACVTRIFFS